MWYILSMMVMALAVQTCQGISFQQPNIRSNATWETHAITVANETVVGLHPAGIFVNTKNHLYATDQQHGRVLKWSNGLFSTPTAIPTKANGSMSLFVMDNDDILVDNDGVDRWFANGTNSAQVMHVNSSCTGLFVDITDYLYCSSAAKHRVFRQGSNNNTVTAVAGTGCPGPLANMLDHPHGIFVDGHFNLFVADTHNNRIQRFSQGQTDGMTVAGFGAPVMFILKRPTSVILDGNGYLFIVDGGNHRIVRSIPNGFECLFGCAGGSGSSASQLNNPYAIAFDSDGQIFVTDFGNHRIQKIPIKESRGMYFDLKMKQEVAALQYMGERLLKLAILGRSTCPHL